MKKNSVFYVCAAAALVLASCQKDGSIEVTAPDKTTSDLEVIKATILPTKTTTQDGVHVLWENGDKIGLRPASDETANASGTVTYVTTLESSAASATFEKEAGQTLSTALRNGKYHALYPSNPLYCNWSGKYERVLIGTQNPGSQVAPDGGGWDDKEAFMIAEAEEGADFVFKHVMAYVKFTVNAKSPEFDKMTISSNSGQALIDRVNIYYDGHIELNTLASYKSTSVTLTTTSGSAFTPGTYYVAILPQTYTGGFTFSFKNGDEIIGAKAINSDVEFARGDVANMGTVAPFSSVPQTLELATVYKEGGKDQGVVYWVNPDNPSKGKIVSVSSAAMLWSSDLLWTAKINSLDDGLANYEQFNGSTDYTNNKSNFYALKYCEDLRTSLGGDWYLPAPNELRTLYKTYYGLSSLPSTNGTDYRYSSGTLIQSAMDTKAGFDAAFRLLGETATATLDGDADANGVCDNSGFGDANGVTYWTSKINTGGKVQYVNFGVYNLTTSTPSPTSDTFYVRCIRNVDVE